MKKRVHLRLLKVLHAKAVKAGMPIEVVPLALVPEPVIQRAVLIRPRRAKGVAKARRPA